MVIYELTCSRGHRFEGWFDDLDDLNGQIAKKMLACPLCGDESLCLCPPAVSVRKNAPAARPPLTPEQKAADAFLRQWEEFSRRLAREFDDVGTGFTDEALKMHYGVAPQRNIRGQSTAEQEDMLRREGVNVLRVPVITRRDS